MNAIAMNISTPHRPAAAAMLADKAMLATLSISGWSARKLDRAVSAETNARHGAHGDAGRYNKRLISGEALLDIGRIAAAARALHYARTLPWTDNGGRLLLAAGYPDYSDNMRSLRRDHERAAATFEIGYPAFVLAAESSLGDMFNAEDYPDAAHVAAKFRFSANIDPVPQTADFRVDVGNDAREIIAAEIEERTNAAMRGAMRDVYSRVADVVGSVVTSLNAYTPGQSGTRAKGAFHESLVGNVRSLVTLIPSLNLTADPMLADLAERMAADLTRYSAPELKESDAARVATRDAAAAILETVSGFLA